MLIVLARRPLPPPNDQPPARHDDSCRVPSLGPVNPLPATAGAPQLHANVEAADLDAEMRANLEHGRVTSLLPYLLQDRYDRTLVPRDHRVAVLENDRLRAEFLLDLGGRLRSLVDLASGRELLYANPAFQPANLALREAWFAGGVEWNIGIRGHTPLTCSPVFAARVEGPERRAGAADVGVRTGPRGRLPGRLLAARGIARARRRGPHRQPERPCGADVLVVQHRGPRSRGRPGARTRRRGVAVRRDGDGRQGGAAGRRTVGPSPTRPRLPERPTTSSTSTKDIGPGSRRSTGPGSASSSRRRPSCGAASSSSGAAAPVDGTGRSGSRLSAAGTSRSRPACCGPSWSTSRCRRGPSGPGSRPTARYRPTRTSCTAPTGPRPVDGRAVAARVGARLLAGGPSWRGRRRCSPGGHRPSCSISARAGVRWSGGTAGGERGLDRAATPFPAESLGPEQAAWVELLDTGRLPSAHPRTPPSSYLVAPAWADRLEGRRPTTG